MADKSSASEDETSVTSKTPVLVPPVIPAQQNPILISSDWLSQARERFKNWPTKIPQGEEAENADPATEPAAKPATEPAAETAVESVFGERYHTSSPTFTTVCDEAAVEVPPRPSKMSELVKCIDIRKKKNKSRVTSPAGSASSTVSTKQRESRKRHRQSRRSSPYARPIVIAPARLSPLNFHPGAAQAVAPPATEDAVDTVRQSEPDDVMTATSHVTTGTRGSKRHRVLSDNSSPSQDQPTTTRRPASKRRAAQIATQQIANLSIHGFTSGDEQTDLVTVQRSSGNTDQQFESALGPVTVRVPADQPEVHQATRPNRGATATVSRVPDELLTTLGLNRATQTTEVGRSRGEEVVEPAARWRSPRLNLPRSEPAILPPPGLDLPLVHTVNRSPREIRYRLIADVRALAAFYAGYGTGQPQVDPLWSVELTPLIKDVMRNQPPQRTDATPVMLRPPNSFPLKNNLLPLCEAEITAPDLALLITMETTSGMTPESLDKLLISDKDSLAEYLSRFEENDCAMTPDEEQKTPTHTALMSRSGYPGCLESGQKSLSWFERRDAIRFDMHAQTVGMYVQWLREKERMGIIYKPCHDTNECENCNSMDKASFDKRVKKFRAEWAATEPKVLASGEKIYPKGNLEKVGGGFVINQYVSNCGRLWHWLQQLKVCKLHRARSVAVAIKTGHKMRSTILSKSDKRKGRQPQANAAKRTNPLISNAVKKAIQDSDPALLLDPLPSLSASKSHAAGTGQPEQQQTIRLPRPLEEAVRMISSWQALVILPTEFGSTTEFRRHTRHGF